MQATARDEGARQKALETAHKMVAKGFDMTDISEVTGLSVEELAEL